MAKVSIIKDGIEANLGDAIDYNLPIPVNPIIDKPYVSLDNAELLAQCVPNAKPEFGNRKHWEGKLFFQREISADIDIDALKIIREGLEKIKKRERPIYSATIAQGIEKFIEEKGERPAYLLIHPNDFAEIAIESEPCFITPKGDDTTRPRFMDVCIVVTPYVQEKTPILIGNEQAQKAEKLINAPYFPSARVCPQFNLA